MGGCEKCRIFAVMIRLFNPSHDECLASGSPYYTPSVTARMMDEVKLPGWYRLSDTLPPWDSIGGIEPWGWDARLVHQLRSLGCPERLLPTCEQLEIIRRLSSRQTAVEVLKRVDNRFQSWWMQSWDDILRLCSADEKFAEGRNLVFKAPWSCSGRGVFAFDEMRIKKILRQQGGIEVEPLFDRVGDFAMEFYCTGGEVIFEGLSCFLTDGGRYIGNAVMEDDEILELMTMFVPSEHIEQIKQRLSKVLQDVVAQQYTGPVGVDQMIVKTSSGYALHPCVEINLRNTMGRLALQMREKKLPDVE